MKNFLKSILMLAMCVCVGFTFVGCDEDNNDGDGGSGLNPTPDTTIETKYYYLNEQFEDNGIKIKVLAAENNGEFAGSSLNLNLTKNPIVVYVEITNTTESNFYINEENLLLTHYEKSYAVHESSSVIGFYKTAKIEPNSTKTISIVFDADEPIASSPSALDGIQYSLVIFGEQFTYNHEVLLKRA